MRRGVAAPYSATPEGSHLYLYRHHAGDSALLRCRVDDAAQATLEHVGGWHFSTLLKMMLGLRVASMIETLDEATARRVACILETLPLAMPRKRASISAFQRHTPACFRETR